MVKILDCTTRDGGHQTNWEFSDNFVKDLIESLNLNGVEFFEIGYRNHFQKEGKGRFFYCDNNLLEEYQSIKNNLKIGIMTDTSRFSINDFPGAKNDLADFIRIACHPDKIQETLNISYELHNRGYKVFVQLMEIPNLDERHYKILENCEFKNIFESLYIADSYGTAQPADLKKFFIRLDKAGYEKISFHAHNNSGMALLNTLEAIKLGAYSIDVSKNGMGGNLDFKCFLEQVKSNF
ncbi:hypothetical protein IJ579_05105 [bacterium]|nr:hypothetical protein [bacterium]